MKRWEWGEVESVLETRSKGKNHFGEIKHLGIEDKKAAKSQDSSQKLVPGNYCLRGWSEADSFECYASMGKKGQQLSRTADNLRFFFSHQVAGITL